MNTLQSSPSAKLLTRTNPTPKEIVSNYSGLQNHLPKQTPASVAFVGLVKISSSNHRKILVNHRSTWMTPTPFLASPSMSAGNGCSTPDASCTPDASQDLEQQASSAQVTVTPGVRTRGRCVGQINSWPPGMWRATPIPVPCKPDQLPAACSHRGSPSALIN